MSLLTSISEAETVTMRNTPSHWLKVTTLPQNDRLIISKEMIRSPAFRDLTGFAKQLLFEIHLRLTIDKLKANKRIGTSDQFLAKNNGEIVMSSTSIRKTCGSPTKKTSSDTIGSAFDQLCSHGFIEIAELGFAVKRTSHKVALTTNWREWGTPGFTPNIGRK